MENEGKDLTQLGSNETKYTYGEPMTHMLETFENIATPSSRRYTIELDCPEFTSLCPKTGQPDFATIKISYVPDKECIETKSLKLYLFAYRQHGSFMESIVNRILNDLCAACWPRWMLVEGMFNTRGGISLKVSAEYDESKDPAI